jgi:hypothetical protein
MCDNCTLSLFLNRISIYEPGIIAIIQKLCGIYVKNSFEDWFKIFQQYCISNLSLRDLWSPSVLCTSKNYNGNICNVLTEYRKIKNEYTSDVNNHVSKYRFIELWGLYDYLMYKLEDVTDPTVCFWCSNKRNANTLLEHVIYLSKNSIEIISKEKKILITGLFSYSFMKNNNIKPYICFTQDSFENYNDSWRD